MYDPPGIVEASWGKRNGGLVNSSSNSGVKGSQIVLTSQHLMQPPLAHQTTYSSLQYNGSGHSNGRNHVGNSIPAHSRTHNDSNGQYIQYVDSSKKFNENQLSPVKKRVKENSPQSSNNGNGIDLILFRSFT